MNSQEKHELFKIAIWVLFIAWVFWLILSIILTHDKDDAPGLFGDFFGAFNALISILGFGAVIYTLQKQDEAGEEERERHLENLALQKRVLEIQELAAKAEANNTFINKLSRDWDKLQEFLALYQGKIEEKTKRKDPNPFSNIFEVPGNPEGNNRFKVACINIFPNVDFNAPATEEAIRLLEYISEQRNRIQQSMKYLLQMDQELNLKLFNSETTLQTPAPYSAPIPPPSPEP